MNLRKSFSLNWKDLSRYKEELYGICAIWIMLFHSYLVKIHYDGDIRILQVTEALLDRGNMGVDIFLFLSGVFLYFSYSAHEGDLGRFMSRRLSRLILPVLIIYSPYWIGLMIDSGNVYKFLLRISTMDFWISGSKAIWFVSMILLCYWFYPYIYTFFFKGKGNGWVRLAVALGLVVLLTYVTMKSGKSFYSTYEIALTRIPVFLLGCFAGKAVKDEKAMSSWTVLLAYLSVIVCTYIFAHSLMPKKMWGRYFYIYSGLSFMTVFIHILKLIPWKAFHDVLKFFGKISLECYLAHIMLINVYKKTPWYVPDSLWRYGVLLVLAVCLAWLTSWICKKITTLRRRKPREA